MTDSRAAENTGDAEYPTASAASPAEYPTASAASPAEPFTAPAGPRPASPVGVPGSRARPAVRIPAGPRLAVSLLLFGYCVYGVGYELSRPEPRLWAFALRGVVGLVAVVWAVAAYTEIRNRGRS